MPANKSQIRSLSTTNLFLVRILLTSITFLFFAGVMFGQNIKISCSTYLNNTKSTEQTQYSIKFIQDTNVSIFSFDDSCVVDVARFTNKPLDRFEVSIADSIKCIYKNVSYFDLFAWGERNTFYFYYFNEDQKEIRKQYLSAWGAPHFKWLCAFSTEFGYTDHIIYE